MSSRPSCEPSRSQSPGFVHCIVSAELTDAEASVRGCKMAFGMGDRSGKRWWVVYSYELVCCFEWFRVRSYDAIMLHVADKGLGARSRNSKSTNTSQLSCNTRAP